MSAQHATNDWLKLREIAVIDLSCDTARNLREFTVSEKLEIATHHLFLEVLTVNVKRRAVFCVMHRVGFLIPHKLHTQTAITSHFLLTLH